MEQKLEISFWLDLAKIAAKAAEKYPAGSEEFQGLHFISGYFQGIAEKSKP